MVLRLQISYVLLLQIWTTRYRCLEKWNQVRILFMPNKPLMGNVSEKMVHAIKDFKFAPRCHYNKSTLTSSLCLKLWFAKIFWSCMLISGYAHKKRQGLWLWNFTEDTRPENVLRCKVGTDTDRIIQLVNKKWA